jgi:hypothetical protein
MQCRKRQNPTHHAEIMLHDLCMAVFNPAVILLHLFVYGERRIKPNPFNGNCLIKTADPGSGAFLTPVSGIQDTYRERATYVRYCTYCSKATDLHCLVADPDPAFYLDANTYRYPTFHFDANPDPAFHSVEIPDPAFLFDANPCPTFHFDADLDLDPAPHKCCVSVTCQKTFLGSTMSLLGSIVSHISSKVSLRGSIVSGFGSDFSLWCGSGSSSPQIMQLQADPDSHHCLFTRIFLE